MTRLILLISLKATSGPAPTGPARTFSRPRPRVLPRPRVTVRAASFPFQDMAERNGVSMISKRMVGAAVGAALALCGTVAAGPAAAAPTAPAAGWERSAR